MSINGTPAGHPTVQNCEQHSLLQDVQPPKAPVRPHTTATPGITHETGVDSTLQQEHLPETTIPAQQYSLPMRGPLGLFPGFHSSLSIKYKEIKRGLVRSY